MESEGWGPDLTEPVFLQEETTQKRSHGHSRKDGCLQTRKEVSTGWNFMAP